MDPGRPWSMQPRERFLLVGGLLLCALRSAPREAFDDGREFHPIEEDSSRSNCQCPLKSGRKPPRWNIEQSELAAAAVKALDSSGHELRRKLPIGTFSILLQNRFLTWVQPSRNCIKFFQNVFDRWVLRHRLSPWPRLLARSGKRAFRLPPQGRSRRLS